MIEIDSLNRDILMHVQAGKIDKELALKILKQLNHDKDIAVIGISCKFPGAKNPDQYWDNLRNSRNYIQEFPLDRLVTLEGFYDNANNSGLGPRIKMGYLDDIDKFDAPFFRISPTEALRMEPAQRIFLETAWESIEDAGYGGNKIYGTRTGVYVGIDSTNKSQYMYLLGESDLLSLTGSTTGILSSRISYILNLHGPSIVVDTVCSGGLVAVHQACMALKNNECSMAIAGGINLFMSYQTESGIMEIESDAGEIRAFDKKAKGTIWGEGAGVLLLKPLSKAIADRDSIYAVIKGSAMNNDGASNGLTAPNPDAQADVITRAWKDAGIKPETISYIEAHGTGTELGDPIEIEGLTSAFRKYTNKKQFCGIGSVKTNIGHTVAASGIASLLKVVLAMKNGEIPPSLNFSEPNSFINFSDSPVYINDKLRKWNDEGHPKRAGVSAFGFSGTNCHVVLEEAPSIEERKNAKIPKQEIFTLSAKNPEVLENLVKGFIEYLEQNTETGLDNICYTASTGRGHYSCRLAIIFSRMDELRQKLFHSLETNFKSLPENEVYYGEHKVVPDNKGNRNETELTEKQKRQLNGAANVEVTKLLALKEENPGDLSRLCNLYVQGADIDWEEIYKDRGLRRVNIPVYPFQRLKYWPKPRMRELNRTDDKLFYKTSWVSAEIKGKDQEIGGAVLIFKDEREIWQEVGRNLRAAGKNVIEVELGDCYRKISENCYIIGNCKRDYENLLEENKGKGLSHIIHLFTLTGSTGISSLQELEDMQQRGVYSLFYLAGELMKSKSWKGIELVLVSEYSCEVTGEETTINPHNEVLFGLGRVMGQENTGLKCRYIDIDSQADSGCILSELKGDYYGRSVAYRAGKRYVEEFSKAEFSDHPTKKIEIKSDGVYIITGGTGGIGLEVSRYLASKNNNVKLAFINRSNMPERNKWDEFLIKGGNDKLCRKISGIKKIELTGAIVELICADISNMEDMKAALMGLKEKYGKINGVIHSAGINGYGPITSKNKAELSQVLLPKVQGTWILDQVTSDDKLDFFVMFSSVASVFGFPGQGDYAAANSYMDSFAQFRSRQGKRTLTINWPAWKETGMAAEHGGNLDGAFKAVSTASGINAFDKLLNSDFNKILVGEINYGSGIFLGNYPFPFMLAKQITERIEVASNRSDKTFENNVDVVVKGKDSSNYSDVEHKLAKIWARVLNLGEINIYENFHDMGGDSILAGQLLKAIEQEYPGAVSILDIYSYPTIVQMAEYIAKENEEIQNFQETKVDEKSNTSTCGDIAIIGMSCKFADAGSLDEFWKNLCNSVNSIRKFPKGRLKDVESYFNEQEISVENSAYKVGYLDEIDKFDASFFKISPREAKLMDPLQRLFLEVAYESIEEAGYGGNKIYNTRTGVYLGVDFTNKSQYSLMINEHEDSLALTGSVTGILASRIAYALNLRGPSVVIDTACSSGLVSLHHACMSLWNNECNMAIAGGINVFILPQVSAGVKEIESVDGAVKAFDRNAKGTAWGEGVGAVFIKPLNKAIKDRDNIYAVIKGSAINNDGASNGITAPNPEAQTDVILKAWERSGINPESISYIETHGTGTVLGDPIEIKGLAGAFKQFTDKKQFCGIGSVKTNIGHTAAASGIASLIKVVLALKNEEIPASLNFREPNHYIDFSNSPVYINDKLRRWNRSAFPRRAGVSSFGFSGTNCHMVLEEAPILAKVQLKTTNSPEVLTLSAKSEVALKKLIQNFIKFIEKEDDTDLTDICYTANTGRGHYNYRIAIILKDKNDIKEKLREMADFDYSFQTEINIDEGVYCAFHKAISKSRAAQGDGELFEEEKWKLSEEANMKIVEYKEGQETNEKLLSEICQLYIKGADVNWEQLYTGKERNRVRLPVYPLERNRCWAESYTVNRLTADNTADEIFYTMGWKPEVPQSVEDSIDGLVIIINDNMGKGEEIAAKLRKAGRKVIEVRTGHIYSKIDDEKFMVSGRASDYDNLVSEISETKHIQIIHLQTVTGDREIKDIGQLKETQERGVYSLFYMSKALLKNNIKANIDAILVSEYVQEVSGSEERINPENATLFGLGKVIAQENKRFRCKCIDIDEATGVDKIIQEMNTGFSQYRIAYRKEKRFAEELRKVSIKDTGVKKTSLKDEGVYIITGGTGGIGLEICKYLASIGRINLALINRSKFPDREKWKEILHSGHDESLCRKIETIIDIESNSSKLIFCNADVSRLEEMEKVLNQLRENYGRINGIIHAAGIAGDGFILKKEMDVFRQVLAPKVDGTWILGKLTEDDKLDFFIMFSSLTSILGGAGQGDYSAANSYLDAFSGYLSRQGRNSLVINWPAWKQTGMAVKNLSSFTKVFKAITTNKAIKAFDRVFNLNLKNVMIAELNYDNEATEILDNLPFEVSDEIKKMVKSQREQAGFSNEVQTTGKNIIAKLKGRTDEESYTELERIVGEIWGGLLELDEININDSFFELGGNSLISIKFELEMEKRNIFVENGDLDRYPTVSELALHIQESQEGKSNKCISKGAQLQEKEIDSYILDEKEEENRDGCILEKIEPFNDVFYKNCFYNSLFPIIHHYNRSINSILVNDVIIYNHEMSEKEGIQFNTEHISTKKLEYIMDDIGLKAETEVRSFNIIEDIVSSLEKGRPVIIWIDCYYESIREDTFKKKHWPHTLLIYGYHSKSQTFNIIEHNNIENLFYKKRIITYKDITASYEGYLDNFLKDTAEPTYYEFYLDETISTTDFSIDDQEKWVTEYICNILKNKELISKGLEHLETFLGEYTKLSYDEVTLKNNAEQLLERLNNIINSKQVEKYRFIRLFGEHHDTMRLINEIIECWSVIRTVVAKYVYSSMYRKDMMISSNNRLTRVYELENLYLKWVCTLT